jgi:hypothetical protein
MHLRQAPTMRACLWAALALAAACRPREPAEVARDRAAEAFLAEQIADLKGLIQRGESGELVSQDRIAISVSEAMVKRLIDASLPQETTIAGRFRVRIESADPFFRGNNAALVFQAVARGLHAETPSARLELGGSLERVRIERGRLTADVRLSHFKVLDTSLGDVAADVLEELVRENAETLTRLLETIEIPVHLEQSLDIDGLNAGGVVARPGVLPLEMTVAEVVPVRERLWVLLDARAGPWQATVAEGTAR